MNEKVEFLRARLGEDETTARAALYVPGAADSNWSDVEYNSVVAETHGMRWAPERVLADIAAKREIISELSKSEDYCNAHLSVSVGGRLTGLRCVVDILLQPYAEHPDFREEWRA